MNEKELRRTKVEAGLAMGETPKDLAEKYNVPYQTVMSWKKKLSAISEGADDVETLVEIDLPTLHAVAEKVKEVAPVAVAKKIDKLVDGVTGLQLLDTKFHTVVVNLLEAAEEMSMRKDLSVKDWSMLSAGIGALYQSIFNKSGVNVNVMNKTEINNEKVSMFRGSMRGA